MTVLALATALLGCASEEAIPSAGDRAGLVAALERVETDPVGAMDVCRTLDGDAQTDCVSAAVSAHPQAALDGGWCKVPGRAEDRDECWFLTAEGLDRLDLCVHAGRYDDDCRVHLWRDRVPKYMPVDEPLSEVVPKVHEAMLAQGFDPSSDALWVASFAHYHEQATNLDRSACLDIEPSRLAHICWDQAREPFMSRISNAWDAGIVSCDAATLPPSLGGMDPEMRAIFDQDWTSHCPGKPSPGDAAGTGG